METETWPRLWLALLVGRWFAATSLPMYYTRTGSGKVSSPMGAQQERGGAVGPRGLEGEDEGLRVQEAQPTGRHGGARDAAAQGLEALTVGGREAVSGMGAGKPGGSTAPCSNGPGRTQKRVTRLAVAAICLTSLSAGGRAGGCEAASTHASCGAPPSQAVLGSGHRW